MRPSSGSHEKEEKARERLGETNPEKSNSHKHYVSAFLQTGQITCHDAKGRRIDCTGSGQDGDFKNGLSWPEPRFEILDDVVLDRLTRLTWTRNANTAEFPLAWQEALDYIARMNRDQVFGSSDWRLPNRRELRSLMSHQARKPALPEGHPFVNVFSSWYWTSTTAAINKAYAWYIHMEGARMFYGQKEQFFLLWPVRGKGDTILPAERKQTGSGSPLFTE